MLFSSTKQQTAVLFLTVFLKKFAFFLENFLGLKIALTFLLLQVSIFNRIHSKYVQWVLKSDQITKLSKLISLLLLVLQGHD